MDVRITLAALLLRRHKDLFADYKADRQKGWLNAMAEEATKRTLTEKEAVQIIGQIKALRAGA